MLITQRIKFMNTIKVSYESKTDPDEDFISYIASCIRTYKIDPEEVPQLMPRVYAEEFGY